MPHKWFRNPMLLREIVEKSGKHLRTELASRIVSHPGELGRARENIVARFLAEHIPGNYETSTGFAFDHEGQISEQLDLIVADPAAGGAYDVGGGAKYFRVESVVAVGQVKSSISSRRELWLAYENLRSASILDRSVGGTAVSSWTGRGISPKDHYLDRIFTFLFVAQPGLSAEVSREVLCDFVASYDHYTWPNLTFFLDSHLLTFHCNDGVCPNTQHATAVTFVKEDGLNLLRFIRFLADGALVTTPAKANASSYLPGLFPVEHDPRFVLAEDGSHAYLSELENEPLPDYVKSSEETNGYDDDTADKNSSPNSPFGRPLNVVEVQEPFGDSRDDDPFE